MEQRVDAFNRRALRMTAALAGFKQTLLNNVMACKMMTGNYPLLLDHIIREARLYVRMLERLQNREEVNTEVEALEQESFWNRIMAEHSKFIRGFLDPTEEDLIGIAENFGSEFDNLTKESLQAMDKTITLAQLTEDSLEKTIKIRDFKEQGTQGLLACKVKSIIIPLLADHVLREASHYLRLLKTYNR
jgi:hypothetical protein